MATKSARKGPSVDDIVEIYEGHGKVFENVFSKDRELIDAFLAWGQVAFPRWYAEVKDDHAPATKAIRLETLIYDEEDEAESVAPFFQQLPAALRDRALARLREDGDGGDDD